MAWLLMLVTEAAHPSYPPMLVRNISHFIFFLIFQPIGRAFALVQPPSDRAVLTPEPVKTTEEQVEVIKVRVLVCRLFFLFCFFFAE